MSVTLLAVGSEPVVRTCCQHLEERSKYHRSACSSSPLYPNPIHTPSAVAATHGPPRPDGILSALGDEGENSSVQTSENVSSCHKPLVRP